MRVKKSVTVRENKKRSQRKGEADHGPQAMTLTAAAIDGGVGRAPDLGQGHPRPDEGGTQGHLTSQGQGHLQPERAAVAQGHPQDQGVSEEGRDLTQEKGDLAQAAGHSHEG
ncbi:hypothetical protein ElyMa_005802500 [Elysia marginata]|uniref:Uncharacterized protein n=1 Tax=Elysia marginata TaxID=1093978 RepID=A0AAV4FTP6_9GAST|nr:hypothetical protein ElyMa_005802500 [Elysia marginata]